MPAHRVGVAEILTATMYYIDRTCLPKPWDKPLVFRARRDGADIEVEVQSKAAIEYQASAFVRQTMDLAHERVADMRETFVAIVEAALNAKIVDDPAPPRRIVLTPDDLDFL